MLPSLDSTALVLFALAVSSTAFSPAPDAPGKRHPRLAREYLKEKRGADVSVSANISASLNLGIYLPEDRWHGKNFFDGWTFWNTDDPTHGHVNYVTKEVATAEGLAYVEPSGKAVMKVDSKTDLEYNANRDSIRITTNKAYNSGLFVLDASHFPYGCAVWPAFWMFGPDWPNNGEIDIFENVNLASSNQYTAHTASSCSIDPNPSNPAFQVLPSSSTLGLTDCGPTKANSGCDYVDNDPETYGPDLNADGGAVLAMQWEDDGIKIWNFPRGHVPLDLTLGLALVPALWPKKYLKASWASSACSPDHFNDMSIVFDMTLCGDWAGGVYPTSGCPGNCTTQVMTGSNFVDAYWEVNYVAVYQKKL